jgi:hypothetical protein
MLARLPGEGVLKSQQTHRNPSNFADHSPAKVTALRFPKPYIKPSNSCFANAAAELFFAAKFAIAATTISKN